MGCFSPLILKHSVQSCSLFTKEVHRAGLKFKAHLQVDFKWKVFFNGVEQAKHAGMW